MDEENSVDKKPCENHGENCAKMGIQYVDISVPIEIKPDAIVGKIESECKGDPIIVCETDCCHNSCEITITQKICIKIPIRYGVDIVIGNSIISCDQFHPYTGNSD